MASWKRILTVASSIKDLSDVYDSMSPSDGQVLTFDTTNGWQAETPSGGSGGVDTSGTPADNQIAVFTDSDTIEGDDNFTWNGSSFNVGGGCLLDSVNVTQATLSSAGDYGKGTRLLTKFGTNTNVTAGKVYYVNSSGWSETDANSGTTSAGIIAVATASTTNPGLVLDGIVKLSTNTGFSSANRGDILYLHTTTGTLTSTRPSGSGDIVRIAGYVADASNSIVYFSPSKDYIEIA